MTSQRFDFQNIVCVGFSQAKEVKVRLIMSLLCRQARDAGYSLKWLWKWILPNMGPLKFDSLIDAFFAQCWEESLGKLADDNMKLRMQLSFKTKKEKDKETKKQCFPTSVCWLAGNGGLQSFLINMQSSQPLKVTDASSKKINNNKKILRILFGFNKQNMADLLSRLTL